MAEETHNVDFANKPSLFGRWTYDDVKIVDPCFKDYIAITTIRTQVYVPHTAGRYQRKKFRKAQCPIVERLAGALMFHGRNTGKKSRAINIIK
jgi:small subunit ribosomal protein S5e